MPPYRTQQAALLHKSSAGSASMQNMTPLGYMTPRRSSAAGLGMGAGASVANGYRSHSVDGLLDQAAAASGSSQDSLSTPEQRIAAAAACVAAGSTALTNASSTCTLQPEDETDAVDVEDLVMVTRRDKQHLAPASVQQHRKSRSLDHILSKQTLAEILPPTELVDETQSMQNLALPPTPQPQRRDTSSSSKSPTPERPQRAGGAYSRRSPDGVSSTESERDERERVSLRSQGSSASGNQQRAAAHVHRGGSMNSNKTSNSSLGSNNSASNKTIFNRTMKKVRSLIKK